MKKWKKILLTAVPATLALSFTSLAGEWHLDMNGWWYEKDDGSYYRNGWYWVDGNEDGLAECYYFTNSGYVANKTRQADGYEVDENGAWTVGGVVQTKEVARPNDSAAVEAYLEAAEKNNALDSIDTDVKAIMSVEAEGESMDMNMDVTMKMRGVKSGNLEYVMDGSMDMLGMEIPISSFYTDGYLYTDSMGMKIKQKTSVYDAIESANSTMEMADVDLSMITDMQMHMEGEDAVITYSVDREQINAMLDKIMGMAAFTELEDSGIEMSYDIASADGEIVIDKNGYYTRQHMYMDMGVTITEKESQETMSMAFKMDMDMNINNPGEPVEFTLPSTEGYTDIADSFSTAFSEE